TSPWPAPSPSTNGHVGKRTHAQGRARPARARQRTSPGPEPSQPASRFRAGKRSAGPAEGRSGAKETAKASQGEAFANNSASRLRFRPPRPTGLPPRGCPLVVEPLGRGFDLIALRARCKGEPIASRGAVQGGTVQQLHANCAIHPRASHTVSSPPSYGVRSNQP